MNWNESRTRGRKYPSRRYSPPHNTSPARTRTARPCGANSSIGRSWNLMAYDFGGQMPATHTFTREISISNSCRPTPPISSTVRRLAVVVAWGLEPTTSDVTGLGPILGEHRSASISRRRARRPRSSGSISLKSQRSSRASCPAFRSSD